MPAKSCETLEALGGEDGCHSLSREFYARVGKDPVLRSLFPGKSMRCATEEFAAFLIQFLGGDEKQTQYRWWLSLRESHARFRISESQRAAWLKQMRATLEAMPINPGTRQALKKLFLHSSNYVRGTKTAESDDPHDEISLRWKQQRTLDDAITAVAEGHDDEAIALAAQFGHRPTVFAGLLARMMNSARAVLVEFSRQAVERDPVLGVARFNGRTLLHHAAGAGCVDVVRLIVENGVNADIQDAGGHTALYRVANECATPAGPEIVHLLLRAGADVNACAGVTRSTALHAAARRGHLAIAQALIAGCAALNVRDKKGATPLQRAINCRRKEVAQLLHEAQAVPTASTRRDRAK